MIPRMIADEYVLSEIKKPRKNADMTEKIYD
jgi:hypothetical protein